jgi:hypothetical protein
MNGKNWCREAYDTFLLAGKEKESEEKKLHASKEREVAEEIFDKCRKNEVLTEQIKKIIDLEEDKNNI